MKARGQAAGDDLVVVGRRKRAGEQHERLGAEVGQFLPAPVARRVALRQAQQEGLAQQLAGGDFGRQPGAVHEPVMDVPAQQRGDLVRGAELQQLQVHGGIRGAEPVYRAVQAPIEHRCEKPHAQHAVQAAMHARRDVGGLAHLRQGLAGFAVERRAGRRQPDVARGPLDQREAQLLFQLADGDAERRLRNIAKPGRAPEMQLLGERGEVLEMAQFYSGSHSRGVSIVPGKILDAGRVRGRHYVPIPAAPVHSGTGRRGKRRTGWRSSCSTRSWKGWRKSP